MKSTQHGKKINGYANCSHSKPSPVYSCFWIPILLYYLQLNDQLGCPDDEFSVKILNDPIDDYEIEMEEVVRREMKFGGPAKRHSKLPRHNKSIRELWEQTEELIDLLEKLNATFGMVSQQ